MKARSIVVLIVAFSILLSACGSAGTQATEAALIPTVRAADAVVAEGRVEPVRFVEIGFNTSGLVSEVLAEEGDLVEAGQILARVENKDAKTLEGAQAAAAQKLADANETLRLAQIKLDDFDIPWDYRTMSPEQAVNVAYERLEKARKDYEPYKYKNPRDKRDEVDDECKIQRGIEICKNTGKYYEKILDDAWAEYKKTIEWLNYAAAVDDAKASVLKAQKNFDDLQSGADLEQTAGTRASLVDAELSAPFPGTLTQMDLKVGESASAGTKVVTIADFSKWVVKTTDLTEIDVVNVTKGQAVVITLDALPDVTLQGTVEAIGQSYSEKQGDIVYEVTVVLRETDPNLRWGMTAVVKFEK